METPTELPEDPSAEAPKNVVPFRPIGESKPPSLTPVENNAFNELARQLSARLESETGLLSLASPSITDMVAEAARKRTSRRAKRRPTSSREVKNLNG